MKFKNSYLNRQIDLMRLNDREVIEIAQKYGFYLDKERIFDPRGTKLRQHEEKLLEILERHESILDRAQEFLAEPEKIHQLKFDDFDEETVEALIVFSEIEGRENRLYYEMLFDIPKHFPLTQVFQRFSENARKLQDSGLPV